MKIVATGIVFLFLSSGLVSSRDDAMKFSRTTVKGLVLERVPEGYRQIYQDRYYQFVVTRNSEGPFVSTFLALDIVQKRWLQITELSTEHARLGKSFDIPPEDTSDFRALGNFDYAQLPLKVEGRKRLPAAIKQVFPDRIRFDSTNELYRMDCNSQLNLPISVTTFWVRKSDLDAIR
jgi:hypothetical protein